MEDLKKLKAKELEELIAGYRGLKVGDKEIEVPEAFKNNAERVSFLEAARKNWGVPRVLTAEDLESNPALKDEGVVEGETVLVPFVAPAPAIEPEKPQKPSKKAEEATDEDVLMFRGREVMSVENKVVNGRLYKEVTTATDTQLLNESEFEREVYPRQ